ncbi:hypothetical protein DDE82_002459 [Stemphylium lycopersici]|nr:hypothetical protein DDE82_002459 [Stemphylium lycopersici]
MIAEAPFAGTRANRRDNPIYIQRFDSPSFYTVGDRVEGILLVAPARTSRISASLRGFSIVQTPSAKSVAIEFYQETQDLFVSFRDGENLDALPKSSKNPGKTELPFSLTFAQHANLPPPPGRDWFHPEDSYNHPRFQHSPGFPLPPSCSANIPTNARIVYQLEACMEHLTPGSLPIRVREELTFVPAPPEFRLALLQPDLNFGSKLPKHCCREKFVRSRKLFPNYDERGGKLMKFKEKLADKELLFGLQSFAEVPYVKFNVFATPASVLIVGSDVPAIITVQHLKRSESLQTPPDLFIRRVKVQLNSIYNTFTPGDPSGRQISKPNVQTERSQFLLFDKKYEKGNGEPLYDGLSLSDIADVKLINGDFVPSFTTYGLNLEYELQIEITGKCADREWAGIVCTQPVQIVTELQTSARFEVADGGDTYEAEPRPIYHEVDPMTRPQNVYASREAHELDSRHNAPPMANNVPPPEYTA